MIWKGARGHTGGHAHPALQSSADLRRMPVSQGRWVPDQQPLLSCAGGCPRGPSVQALPLLSSTEP